MAKVIGNDPVGPAVQGSSTNGIGIAGKSTNSFAVFGESINQIGVYGTSDTLNGTGIEGYCAQGVGISGKSLSGTGMEGTSETGNGVIGRSTQDINGIGVYGESTLGTGVKGFSPKDAVYGESPRGNAVYGVSTAEGIGIRGYCLSGGKAGLFVGEVHILGSLIKSHIAFKIDHPLDPAHKYLCHSGVESSDMKNIYDGVVVLDAQGRTTIELPTWFEALNQEFRYQLTPIGAAGPNLHIAEEIREGRFKIAGGAPGMKVCWQVTGSRKDAWAQANPLIIEQDKSAAEQGYYLHPESHGHSREKCMPWARDPEPLRRSVEEQQRSKED